MPKIVAKHRGEKFAADVETSGLSFRKDRLLGIALAFESGFSYYIVLEHTLPTWDGTTYVEKFIDSAELAYHLTPFFSQPDVVMVFHNAKFDLHFLHANGLFVQGRLFDTLLAAQLLDENRPNGLKDLAAGMDFKYEKYTNLGAYPGYSSKEILGVPLPVAAAYAMNDVDATWMLYERFREELANEEMQGVFNKTWMPLLPVLQQMEARGIALDLEKVRVIRGEYVQQSTELEKKIRALATHYILEHYEPNQLPKYYLKEMATEDDLNNAYTRDDGVLVTERDGIQHPIITHEMIGKTKTFRPRIVSFNTGSSTQMQELIYTWSGVELPTEIDLKLNKTGYSCDKDNIETIIFYAKEDAPEFLRWVLDWRKASKFITTYLDRFLADADPNDHNSISTSFNQAVGETGRGGTTTGRLSSSQPNLQNIPSRGIVGKEARSMFVSRPGHKLIVADYSQMELRMLAHYSLDPVLLQAFAEGRDMHIVTATAPARMSYEELKEKYDAGDPWAKEMRAVGKTMNFALNYGMGAVKFRRFLLVMNKYEVTEAEAAEWIREYNKTYEATTKWKERVKVFVGNHGYVKTIRGRKRRLPGVYSYDKGTREYAKRQGVNAVIQGSCGDVICEAMIPIQAFLLSIGGSLLLQVHDELVAEVPEQHAELAARVMERLMVDFINPILKCPMSADAHIGDNWSEAKG